MPEYTEQFEAAIRKLLRFGEVTIRPGILTVSVSWQTPAGTFGCHGSTTIAALRGLIELWFETVRKEIEG